MSFAAMDKLTRSKYIRQYITEIRIVTLVVGVMIGLFNSIASMGMATATGSTEHTLPGMLDSASGLSLFIISLTTISYDAVAMDEGFMPSDAIS
jgi:hypothetical protein